MNAITRAVAEHKVGNLKEKRPHFVDILTEKNGYAIKKQKHDHAQIIIPLISAKSCETHSSA